MNRAWYRVLWLLEIVMVLVLAFVTLPIEDYARREFKEWQRRPSPETMRAFLEKSNEESQLRRIIAVPFTVAAVLLVFPLARFRSKWPKQH